MYMVLGNKTIKLGQPNQYVHICISDELELENFPARAEPSYEGAEPSWGTSIFELKPS